MTLVLFIYLAGILVSFLGYNVYYAFVKKLITLGSICTGIAVGILWPLYFSSMLVGWLVDHFDDHDKVLIRF
jgi:hypothetical protein